MATPLLSLVIYAIEDTGTPSPRLDVHTVASGRLKLQADLDARVSLLATNELAKVSPSFAADLEATTHFMERLEAATRNITDQLVMPDSLAELELPTPDPLLKPGAKHIAEQVFSEHFPNGFDAASSDRVFDMLQRAVHLARE